MIDLVKEDENKKIFVDGNKIYSMINMGNYVGHKYRQWYDSASDFWMLMYYDEKRDDGKQFHIEALIDDIGNYTRFLIKLGDQKRVMLIDNGMVFSDIIISIKDKDYELGDEFISLDGDIYSKEKVLLEEYLGSKQSFSLDDQIYDGELSNNDFISEFLKKNEELKEYLRNGKKR